MIKTKDLIDILRKLLSTRLVVLCAKHSTVAKNDHYLQKIITL